MDEIESQCIDLGDQEVVVVDASLAYRVRYWLLSILAWAVAILDFDPSGDVPRPPYRVIVRDKDRRRVLYEEDVVYYGEDAFDTAQQFANEITKAGIDDFVYKKSRGWRID